MCVFKSVTILCALNVNLLSRWLGLLAFWQIDDVNDPPSKIQVQFKPFEPCFAYTNPLRQLWEIVWKVHWILFHSLSISPTTQSLGWSSEIYPLLIYEGNVHFLSTALVWAFDICFSRQTHPGCIVQLVLGERPISSIKLVF